MPIDWSSPSSKNFWKKPWLVYKSLQFTGNRAMQSTRVQLENFQPQYVHHCRHWNHHYYIVHNYKPKHWLSIQQRRGCSVTNSITTTEQSVTQACTPTIVYRTETIGGSGTVVDNQPLTVIAALTIIIIVLVMLLVTVSISLIWTCWKPKLKRGLKRGKQQVR